MMIERFHNNYSDWKDNNDGDYYATFQTFGVEVLGLDLSENMVDIAMERAITEKLPTVRLNVPVCNWLKHHT